MCPGRPPAAASTASAPASTLSQGPSRTAPSRLPWTPRSRPTASHASSSRARPPEPDAHVGADHAPAGGGHRLQQMCRTGAEVDRRNGQAAEDPLGVRRDELLVVVDRERTDPAVEELDYVGAGLRLGADVAKERLAEPLHQLVPRL